MNSKKKDVQPNQSDIHTIVDLPIEAVLDHIAQIPSEKYQVEINQNSVDEAIFRISNKLSKGTLKLDTQGTIRRWNGTFARLDANFNIRFTRFSYRLRLLVAFGIVISLFPIALYFIGNLQDSPKQEIGIGLGLVIVCLTIFFLTIISGLLLYLSDKWGASGANSSIKHNEIIHGLVDELGWKLKQKAASLDFDGTEANLTLLLQAEQYKRFSIADDGEMRENN